MIGPLVVEFVVATSVEQAFAAWTKRCAEWWPADHTISRAPVAIVFEPRAGGRIFERARDGAEHEWGAIVVWDPPGRVVYRWHLFFDPAEATDVEVRFRATGGVTTVRIEQRGWERLGEAGPPRRERAGTVWRSMASAYAVACEERGPPTR